MTKKKKPQKNEQNEHYPVYEVIQYTFVYMCTLIWMQSKRVLFVYTWMGIESLEGRNFFFTFHIKYKIISIMAILLLITNLPHYMIYRTIDHGMYTHAVKLFCCAFSQRYTATDTHTKT